MESVKQRIADLESAGKVVGGLSLSSEFELSCLRELIALTEQRDALVVENVGLKEALTAVIDRSSEPEYHYAGMGCGVEDNGLQTDGYGACEYGWHEAMQRVYSEVIPETPATDAAIASLRAEGVEMLTEYAGQEYQQPSKSKDEKSQLKFVVLLGTAFARQLRESKGANHE